MSVLSLTLAWQDDALAQSQPVTPPGAQALPQVDVTRARPVQRARPRARTVTATQAVAPTLPVPGQNVFERGGIGPVQGYVATRSATGTKTDTPLLLTPQAISVVPEKQVRDQGAQTLSETLRYTPGATTNTYGNNSLFDTITVRGFQVPIYVDGLRLPVDPGSNFASPRVEPFGFERFEVLRGPSSGLYGQSPPGGLVNAISKRPTDVAQGSIGLQGGNFDRKQAMIDSSGPLDPKGEWLYRLTGLVRDSGTQLDFVRDNRLFVAPALTWRPTTDTSLTFLASTMKGYGAGYQQYSPGVGTLVPNPNGRIPYSRYLGEPATDYFQTEQGMAGYAFDHRFNNFVQFKSNFRYTTSDTAGNTFRVGGINPDLRTANRGYIFVDSSVRNFAADNSLQFDFGTGPIAHKALVGIDYYNTLSGSSFGGGFPVFPIDVFNPVYGTATPPANPFVFLDSRARATQIGAYIQDQVKFDRWVVTLTGRMDEAQSNTLNRRTSFGAANQVDQSDKATTGRAGLTYVFDNGVAPYAQISSSFVPVNGTDFGGRPFKPTTGQSSEVGVKYQPVGTQALFTAAAFDITQQNVLTADLGNPGFSLQTGEVRVKGFEFEGRYSLNDHLDVVGGYSIIDPRVTQSNFGNVGRVVVNVPVETASAWAIYNVSTGSFAGWGIGGGARYVGGSFADNLNQINTHAYTLYDGALSYDFAYLDRSLKGFNLQVNVINLADTYYVASCFDLAFCALGQSRTILATLRYEWGPDVGKRLGINNVRPITIRR